MTNSDKDKLITAMKTKLTKSGSLGSYTCTSDIRRGCDNVIIFKAGRTYPVIKLESRYITLRDDLGRISQLPLDSFFNRSFAKL